MSPSGRGGTRYRRLARRALLALLPPLVLAGCADTGYYLQSVGGHMALMRLSKPIPEWLADPQSAPALKTQLQLAQQLRQYAVDALKLPDNASYHRYADLHRRAVVWNVVAAPEFSLTAKTWCFPVTGCVGYRGYFDEQEANAFGAGLKGEGLEVSVYGVPAYSTLGWMNWAGGDPILNTFIFYPEGELARLLFHELAHQVAYAQGDTGFNESYATAVERLGVARWLATHGTPAARQAYERLDARRRQFRALALDARQALNALYPGQPPGGAAEQAALRAAKQQRYAEFHARYAQVRAGWLEEDGRGAAPAPGGRAASAPTAAAPRVYGYDNWVASANNASFAALAAYDDLVPAFEALFARLGSDWPRFHAEVQRIAKLGDKAQRRQALGVAKATDN